MLSPDLLLGSLDESREALEQSFAVLVGGMLLKAKEKKIRWPFLISTSVHLTKTP